MSKWVLITVLCGLLCVGCDSAANQQQAEDARRAAAAAHLKQLGESLHESQKEGSSEGTGTTTGKDISPASHE